MICPVSVPPCVVASLLTETTSKRRQLRQTARAYSKALSMASVKTSREERGPGLSGFSTAITIPEPMYPYVGGILTKTETEEEFWSFYSHNVNYDTLR